MDAKQYLTSNDELELKVFEQTARLDELNRELELEITERKRAETALRESEEKFRLVYDTIPDSIVISRIADGVIVSVNKGFEQISGYTREDVIGKPASEINSWKDPEDRRKFVEELQSRGEVRNYEAPLLTRNGEIYGLMSAAVINLNGVPHLLGITRDITERKLVEKKIRASEAGLREALEVSNQSRQTLLSVLEDQQLAEGKIRILNATLEEQVVRRTAQLEASNKELEAFSYSVSHDLRAPLRGIDGWSLSLLEDYGGQLDATAQTYIQRVRSETQRMGQLIDDIQKLSRMTRAEMRHERVDLSAIAKTVAGRLRESEPQRLVKFEIQPGLCIQGDAQLLEILFTNLLGNAFKFTGKTSNARIEFGQTVAQGKRAFFVRDNGAGFDMAYAHKLFGAFQRMHKTSEFSGTGVGLATVQRIIHRHGGSVWAEAQVNQGATFYFTLEEER